MLAVAHPRLLLPSDVRPVKFPRKFFCAAWPSTTPARMTSQRLSDTASKLDAASKLLRAKPEQSLIGDVGRAHGDARSAAASLAQQARALHLFDILDAPETQAVACIADLDRHAAVYATCAGLFLSLCGGVVHKLAASPCADVLRLSI